VLLYTSTPQKPHTHKKRILTHAVGTSQNGVLLYIHIHTHHIHPLTHAPSVSLPVEAKYLPFPQAERLGDHLGPRPALAHHERGRLACVWLIVVVVVVVGGLVCAICFIFGGLGFGGC